MPRPGRRLSIALAPALLFAACDQPIPELRPEPGVFLDRARALDTVRDPRLADDRIAYTGLIDATLLDPATGKPIVGAGQHLALDEAQATYDRLAAAGDYEPLTLDGWRTRYGFPAREPGEALADYRARTGTIVYYNVHELGLGRELGCRAFADHDVAGAPAEGVACFVTNYGASFDDAAVSTADAIRGEPKRNTVCIVYIPSLPVGYQVQFSVYGATDQRQNWAQLDPLGPRPSPFVCTGCHGGTHDVATHLTRDARFLPTFPKNIAFPSGPPYDLATQEESIRRMNELAFGAGPHGSGDQKLTPEQRLALEDVYGGEIHTPGRATAGAWVPAAWTTTQRDRDVYTQVVDPYCMTCHGAMADAARQRMLSPARLYPWVETSVCGAFSMPNAAQTSHRFWSDGPITIDGRPVATPADALLEWAGRDRAHCPKLAAQAGCLRDGEPVHALCGSDHSGTVCLPEGTCGPALDRMVDSRPAGLLGYCTMDGARGCPSGQVCAPLTTPADDGWVDGGCFLAR